MIQIFMTVDEFKNYLREAVREEIGRNQLVNSDSKEDRLLNIREACQFLGLSKPTIYSLIKSGKLQSTYLARNRLRFQKSHLMAYVERE